MATMGRVDRIAEPWGTRTPYAAGEDWPTRVDQHLQDGVDEADVERWANAELKETAAQVMVTP